VTQTSLAIGGMTCGACAVRVERRLNKIEGVHATVNYASERASVVMGNGVSTQQLIGAIHAIGFTAELIRPAAQPIDTRAATDRRLRTLRRRLLVAGLLFMPVCDLSIGSWLAPSLRSAYWQWVLLALAAPVVTWAAFPFYQNAARGLRHRTYTMDTLVSIGILAAASWSLYELFWPQGAGSHRVLLIAVAPHHPVGTSYLDVSVGVTTFLLGGRYFEALAKRRTGDALGALASIAAKDVTILDDSGQEVRRPVTDLVVGARFVVRPGESIATDGEVIDGGSSIDRSAITGESLPVEVRAGDQVIGGTICVGGHLVVRASTVGIDTQLGHMMRLVEDAQNAKAGVQRLADRVSGVFVPAVVVAAATTLAGWLLAGGSSQQAFRAALSVLIIACPCALGLATPTALLVASGEGARLGIFFKSYQGMEASRRVDTLLLDKTGTVTQGTMAVTDVATVAGTTRREVLCWAGAVEQASEHLIARAIASAATAELPAVPAVENFSSTPGLGASGTVDGHRITIGRRQLFDAGSAPLPSALADFCAAGESLGQTVVLVGHDDVVVGAIAVADVVRPSAAAAVAQLKELRLHIILVTGDNEPTARAIADLLGIDDVVAGALPSDKVALIRRLQSEGRSVGMVGDGVNDGPALATADLGLAIGSGTDVAINAADLIIVRDDLRIVPTAIDLARRTLATIRGNLAWAFAYNVAAIPLAACGLLNPLIAGGAMAFSSVFVVWNSSRLRRFSSNRSIGRPRPDRILVRSTA
jgi:Cu+-exporting ATPase